MLAWAMNMGFAASPAGAPPAVTRTGHMQIAIGTFIRVSLLVILIGDFLWLK